MLELKKGERKKRSKIWFIPKQDLEEIVKNSETISNILKSLGMLNKGNNFKTLKSRLAFDNIDYSHIKLGRDANKGRTFPSNATPLEDVLVVNSSYSRYNLKIRAFKEGILKNECYICKLKPEWNGQPLSLQLDHINGISDDNRIENLRILCPNCHTQTDNFAGKRKKVKNFCGCGNKIFKTSKSCVKCSNKINSLNYRKVERPSLEVLKEDIKNLNYSGTGRKYGVSDNAIRKWIKFYENNL